MGVRVRSGGRRRGRGARQSAINVAEGTKQAEIRCAEGYRQAAILRAEEFSLALERIYRVASLVDETTMALQYLEAFKALRRLRRRSTSRRSRSPQLADSFRGSSSPRTNVARRAVARLPRPARPRDRAEISLQRAGAPQPQLTDGAGRRKRKPPCGAT
jgi:hypothetical protein